MKLLDTASEALIRAEMDGQDHMAIAKKSGVSHIAIWNWVNGKNSPRTGLLEAVVNACGYDIEVTLIKREK